MQKWAVSSVGLLLGLFATQVLAVQVQVSDAWVRQSLRGEKVTSAFVTLEVDGSAELIAASSDVSESVALAQVGRHPSGFVTNRIVQRIPLVPEKPNALSRDGYHLMLMNLKPTRLQAGQMIQIHLKIKGKDGEIVERDVKAPVRGLLAR